MFCVGLTKGRANNFLCVLGGCFNGHFPALRVVGNDGHQQLVGVEIFLLQVGHALVAEGT